MIIGIEGGQVEGNSQRGTRPLQGLEIPHGKRTGKPLQCFDQECLSGMWWHVFHKNHCSCPDEIRLEGYTRRPCHHELWHTFLTMKDSNDEPKQSFTLRLLLSGVLSQYKVTNAA